MLAVSRSASRATGSRSRPPAGSAGRRSSARGGCSAPRASSPPARASTPRRRWKRPAPHSPGSTGARSRPESIRRCAVGARSPRSARRQPAHPPRTDRPGAAGRHPPRRGRVGRRRRARDVGGRHRRATRPRRATVQPSPPSSSHGARTVTQSTWPTGESDGKSPRTVQRGPSQPVAEQRCELHKVAASDELPSDLT